MRMMSISLHIFIDTHVPLGATAGLCKPGISCLRITDIQTSADPFPIRHFGLNLLIHRLTKLSDQFIKLLGHWNIALRSIRDAKDGQPNGHGKSTLSTKHSGLFFRGTDPDTSGTPAKPIAQQLCECGLLAIRSSFHPTIQFLNSA